MLKRSISFVLVLLMVLTMAFSAFAKEAAPGGVDVAITQLRAGMVARQPEINVLFLMAQQPTEADLAYVMAQALAHTGNPTEGDYLEKHMKDYEAHATITQAGDQFQVDAIYQVHYYTTAQQELEVENKINELLVSWNLANATEYEKIAKIYEYITSTVQYDFTNLKNDAYTLKYSAYAALIDQISVCQGYANLFYRMALSLGVDCRIISGQSMNEKHAWNIAKLGGQYYYLDTTWDRAATDYHYYLKGTSTFLEHQSDPQFLTPEFQAAYPISATDYDGTAEPQKPVISFIDVPADAYYEEGVLWAVEKEITNGTEKNKFSPDMTCSRGQIVTFLWRANGKPEPSSSANPFIDLDPNAYYYKAVLWAVEKGITNGTTETTFSPAETCTRAQSVTFLHRSQGKPKVGSANPFVDVANGSYYYDAVLWAVENEITNGTEKNKFSPDMTCSRGQIVTFLYRSMT